MATNASATPLVKAEDIRSMGNDEIKKRLTKDIERIGNIPKSSVNARTPLTAMLDSMTLSQFQGMLELQYATKLSDEYLFRDSTTVDKLVEVVRLGYAPDDEGTAAPGTSAQRQGTSRQGNAKGLAGALGCPPGVVCCSIM